MKVLRTLIAVAAAAFGVAAAGAAQAQAESLHVFCRVRDNLNGARYYSAIVENNAALDPEQYSAAFLSQIGAKYNLPPDARSSCSYEKTRAAAESARADMVASDKKVSYLKSFVVTDIAPAPPPTADVELECTMRTGSRNADDFSRRFALEPNRPWRLSFNPGRNTVTMKQWYAYNAPAVTPEARAVSITPDQVRFCLLRDGCKDGYLDGYVTIDRRTRALEWQYMVGFERKNGPLFQTVMSGQCEVFKEKPQAF